ncbi:MAG: hypothetical protein Q9173_005326 [Seirophora scorigena]
MIPCPSQLISYNLLSWIPGLRALSPTTIIFIAHFLIDNQMDSQHGRHALSPSGENTFFRSWALRTRSSEYSSTSDVSPGTRSPARSPISPKSQGRPRLGGFPSYESRSSDSHSVQLNQFQRRADVAASPAASSPGTQAQERRSTRTRASMDSRASRNSSSPSSVAKRALRVLKAPALVKVPPARGGQALARPARGGFAWSGQISGHRLEIRLGKTAKTDVVSPSVKISESPHAPYPTHNPSVHTTATYLSPIPIVRRHSSQLRHIGKSADSPVDERARTSVVDRTKRMLGIKSTTTSPSPAPSPSSAPTPTGGHSPTQQALHLAGSALGELAEKQKLTPPSGSTTSTSNVSALSIAGRPKHSRGKLRPGYRRRHTGHSSSSSVLRAAMGKVPVGTPDSDCMYTGSDAQQYFRVELTEPGAPTYLPSEARRIGTPPLPQAGSKLRGFFFDYNAPQLPEEQANTAKNTVGFSNRQQGLLSPSSPPSIPRSPGTRTARGEMNVDWFRIKVGVDEVMEERDKFELNVPEHLPSSPLCPRHPKHRSGGKGVCVYHGRNKSATDEDEEEGGLGWR